MCFHRAAAIALLRPALLLLLLPACCAPLCAAQNDQPRQDPAKAARALVDAALPLIKDNHFDEGLQKLHQAFDIAMQAKDGDLVAEIAIEIGMTDLAAGNEEEAQKAFNTNILLYQNAGANDMVIATLKTAINISHSRNRHKSEIYFHQQLADTYARLSDFKSQADALADLLNAYDELTEMNDICETLDHQLLPLYQKLDDRPGLARAWFAEGRCRAAVGDTQGTVANYEKAIEICRALGDKTNLAAALDSTAGVLRTHGRAAEALPMQQESVNLRKDLKEAHDYAQSLNDLALVNQELGHLPDAVKEVEESVRLSRTLDDKGAMATVLVNQAGIYRDVGRFDDAFKSLKESLQVSRDACLTDDARKAMKIMATVHAAMGDAMQAAAAEAVAEDTTDICADKKKGEIPGWNVEPLSGQAHFVPAGLLIKHKHRNAITLFQAPSQNPSQNPSPDESWIIVDDPDAREAHEHLQSAIQMLNENHIDDAIQALQEALPVALKSREKTLPAAIYVWLGNALLRNRNEPEGQKAIDQAVEFFQKSGDTDDVLHAFKMAVDLGRENNLPGTETRYLRKLANACAQQSDPHQCVLTLDSLATADQNAGHLPNAVEAIEHSVQLTRAGSDKDSLASALIDEAAIYRDSGRLDDALKSVKEALQVSRGACLSDDARSAMKVMATVHRGMGDADRAADDQRVANDPKDICAEKQDEASGQENKEPAYMTTHNMSIALVQMGMYPKAIENFKAELKKAEADHDPSASAEAEEGLGFAYAESSQFALAESSLLEAERLLRQLGNPRAIAHVQTSVATLYTKMGRYYDALDVYEEIKRSSASLEDIQLQINTLLSTAELYRHLKSYDQAFADAQHALQLTQNNGFRNLMSEAQLTMALVRLAQENYEEAENLFQESAKNGPSNAIINEGLVEVRLSTGRYADAEKDLARVSPDVLAGADSSYRLQYYTQRGMARLGLGQIEDAISDFNSAIKESEEMRAQFTGLKSTGFLDSGSFGGRVRPYRGMLEAFATLAVSGLPFKATVGEVKTDAATAAFDYAELARGRSLTEKLALSRMDEIRKQVPASVLEEEQQLNDRLMEFARQHHEHPESPPTPEEAAEFLKLQNEARAHLDTLEKTYPLYARVFRPGIIPADELPLANDEALLEYAIGLHNVYVFVISHDHIVHCNELTIPVEQLEAKVRVFRNLVVAKRFSPAMAYDLFLNLMGGVPHYEELPRRLVIVPDGFLALLPFEALTTTSAGEPTFLGAAHSITYAQSAGILTFTRKFKRTSAAKPLFALGDPIFASTDPRVASAAPIPPQGRAGPAAAPNADLAAATDLSHPNHPYRRLAETQTEVETLASILGVAPRPPDVLTGADATKSTLQKIDLGTYRYLHFATHAAALGEPGRVNEPFLVLTQIGNPPGDDGLLKMSEIMDLKLRSDLVVLGACDTGEGDILEGDGVASLASAFQFAGAESVVLSLWELPSEATLPFMQTFYEQLKLGHSKTEALQMSRDAMRRQHADPYYWAVFALYSGASS